MEIFQRAFAREEESYAWAKMRQLQKGKLPTLQDATLYRKYSGNQKADIVWPEEAEHFQHELFELTANSNDSIAAVMHTKEAKLNIATWDKWLGGHSGPVAKMFNVRYGEHEGERKYAEVVHFMNDRYPNKILADKLLKYSFYLLLITSLFLFYKVADSAKDELDASTAPSGGSHAAHPH